MEHQSINPNPKHLIKSQKQHFNPKFNLKPDLKFLNLMYSKFNLNLQTFLNLFNLYFNTISEP